ncbi:MAG: glycosyltransferase [bacterium]|nr:glycosyltransferase [bacterium]
MKRLKAKAISDYRTIADKKVFGQINSYARRLKGARILMMNSTATAGGVAEILNSLVLLLNSVGLPTDWQTIKGPESFFTITKSFHNAFQGEKIRLSKKDRELYEKVNFNNTAMIDFDKYDLVVIHDPQPLPIIAYAPKKVPWLWRFHPDMTKPDKTVLNYLKPFIEKYDAMIITSKKYRQPSLKISQTLITPSIDPLSDKNKPLSKAEIGRILSSHNIKLNKPLITQISRFDKWKDPVGVIKVYKEVRKKIDCRLVLMGNIAEDDPEGPDIYQQVLKLANNHTDILLNCKDNDLLVNALQRASDVIFQKSIREGFALTVSEALWKGTPVVGSRVGGIPLQVIDGKTGFLVSNNKQAAAATVKLLSNKKLRTKLGRQGREHVRKNFLITRHVLDYLKLFDSYLNK